jgi:hypothetical protein
MQRPQLRARRDLAPVIAKAPLLSGYFEAVCLAEQAARELRGGGAVIKGRASPWLVIQEKSVRAMVALAMRLRLAPQARSHPRSVARERAPPDRKPWDDYE